MGDGGAKKVVFSSLPHVSFFPFYKCFLLQNWCFFAIRAKITVDYKLSLKCHEDAEFA